MVAKRRAKTKSKTRAKRKSEDDLVKVIGAFLLNKGMFDQAAKLAVSMGWSREGFVKFFSTTAQTFYDMHAAGEAPDKTTLERILQRPTPPAAPERCAGLAAAEERAGMHRPGLQDFVIGFYPSELVHLVRTGRCTSCDHLAVLHSEDGCSLPSCRCAGTGSQAQPLVPAAQLDWLGQASLNAARAIWILYVRPPADERGEAESKD